MDHTHDWKPVGGECASYQCADADCGIIGRKDRTGKILPYAQATIDRKNRGAPVRPTMYPSTLGRRVFTGYKGD